MARIVVDKDVVHPGEHLIVHYYGFEPNSTAYIAWMEEVDGSLINVFNAAGEFTTSSTGSGAVEIDTTQGGRELPPGKYWIYMWDTEGNHALAGPIEIVTGISIGSFNLEDMLPVALAAGAGIGSYIITKKPMAAVAGAAVGGIGGWFMTRFIPKKK